MTPEPEATSTPITYQWTRSRRLLALGLIVAGAGLLTFLVREGMTQAGVTTRDLRVWIATAIAGDALNEAAPSGPRSTPEQRQANRMTSLGKNFDVSNLTIDPNLILSGGPPKDGIPALTEPVTKLVAKASFMRPTDRVIGVEHNGHARAYPISVLNYHEVINDQLGGIPIGVVYCPLCDSVTVVDRRLGGKTYEFGVSGLLTNSNVLMYDRTDGALWSQVKLEAVSGPHAGKSLRHLDGWQLTTFATWSQMHPDSTVVTYNTGHKRDYTGSPYAGYFDNDRLMFQPPSYDKQFPNKTPVIGIRLGDVRRAYLVSDLLEQADDKGSIVDEIGSERVSFTVADDGRTVHVVETPDSAQVVHTFWFAWSAFHPGTEIFGRPASTQPALRTDAVCPVPGV